MRPWATIGAVFGLLAVALGAFGAHALREQVTPERLAVFQTAVHYQVIHALALLIVGLWNDLRPSAWLSRAGWAFTLGVLVFSGSLYALVTLDSPRFGMITPIGGVSLMLGWGCVIAASRKTH